jgi:hypothetical protein
MRWSRVVLVSIATLLQGSALASEASFDPPWHVECGVRISDAGRWNNQYWSHLVKDFTTQTAEWISVTAYRSGQNVCAADKRALKSRYVSAFEVPRDDRYVFEALVSNSGEVAIYDADGTRRAQLKITDTWSLAKAMPFLKAGTYKMVANVNKGGADDDEGGATGFVAALFDREGGVVKQTANDGTWVGTVVP